MECAKEKYVGRKVQLFPSDTYKKFGVIKDVNDLGWTIQATEAWLREYFLGKGLNEEEVDEILQYFDDDEVNDFKIKRIYESAEELGEYYLLELGDVDEYIAAVLDVSELGKHIVSVNTTYMTLASGRVVEFEW